MTDSTRPRRSSSSHPSGPATTASGRCSRFGQDPRWRRAMVSQSARGRRSACSTWRRAPASSPERLLARGHRVTGLDQSPDMLEMARRRFGDRVELVEASATAIPFADATFDHLTFTYLLRYVDDPGATLAELARVVRPGGTIANLEFCLPRGIWRPLWDLYVGVGLPALGRIASTRLVRRRPLPRPLDPRLLRALSARAPARALARGRRSTASGRAG